MTEERRIVEQLRATLAELMATLPKRMVDYSIVRGRQAKEAYPKAEKILKKPNATIQELQNAINSMR